MSQWVTVRLGDILTESKVESLTPSIEKRIRVLLNAQGVVKRPVKKETKGATKYFIRSKGQFIYGKQNIHKGAFGVIPCELDGFESTSDLPAFDVDEACLPKWIDYYLKQGDFYLGLEGIARGVATKRVQPKEFLELEIPLPPKEKQEEIIAHFERVKTEDKGLKGEITHQQTLLKKLRQQILQEAIEGKLTADWRAQNPDVEPASELLARIKAEKEQLIKDKKVKRGKKQSASESYKGKVEVPNEWEFPDLDDITQYITDGTHQTPSYTLSGRKFLSAQNVKPFRFMPENHRFVSETAYQEYIKNRVVEKGDLLLGRVGAGIGETAVVDVEIECAIYVSLGLVKTFKINTSSDYLAIVFNSPYGVEYAKGNVSSGGGSAGNFNLGRIRAFKVPFPPLTEQQAIVAKVEKLFAICDQLEAQISQNQTHAEQLMQAVLKEAFQHDDPICDEISA